MAGQPVPEGSPAFDPVLPPSSSLLFYLFAEHVVPRALLGTKAPKTETRVNTKDLGRMLLAVAFWQVRELGLARLELKQERTLLQRKTTIEVTLVARDSVPHRDGIEGGLVDVLTPGSLHMMTPAWHEAPKWPANLTQRYVEHLQQALDAIAARPDLAGMPSVAKLKDQRFASDRPPPATVEDVIRHWYGGDITSPERLPISWTAQEGVAKGYLREGEHHGMATTVATAVFGQVNVMPDRARIATVESAFIQLHERWERFQASEPDLAKALEHEVAEGIERMRYVSTYTP